MPSKGARQRDYVPTWVSPLYGTHLQNRVWNLQKDKSVVPDAVLFTLQLHQLDSQFPAELKVNKSDYVLVLKNNINLLFLRKDFMLKPGKQERLNEFLKRER
jgi:hypothetical protein